MKNSKIVLSMLAVATIASSCSVTKRTYSDGYHVEWYHRDYTPEKITTSQKESAPKEESIEAVTAGESLLNRGEDPKRPANDSKSAPLKENNRPIADRSNTIKHHPVPFVKNGLQQLTKQVVKVKESSNKKAMGILNSLVVVLLSLVLLVVIIFVISILL